MIFYFKLLSLPKGFLDMVVIRRAVSPASFLKVAPFIVVAVEATPTALLAPLFPIIPP
jgi:hypothetical protein